jgi:hypothetical protein
MFKKTMLRWRKINMKMIDKLDNSFLHGALSHSLLLNKLGKERGGNEWQIDLGASP